jgi:adenylate cyclase
MPEQRIQRRLAAILAADVVGYSRLMERDEAGTLVALKLRRRNILDPLLA